MNTENIGLMKLSRFAAWLLLAVLLTLLVFGTQMPGAWRDETFRVTHLPGQLADVAHFVLFAGLAALALGLATEGLQHYASHREPSWQDVGIDMAGAVLGLARWKLR